MVKLCKGLILESLVFFFAQSTQSGSVLARDNANPCKNVNIVNSVSGGSRDCYNINDVNSVPDHTSK